MTLQIKNEDENMRMEKLRSWEEEVIEISEVNEVRKPQIGSIIIANEKKPTF